MAETDERIGHPHTDCLMAIRAAKSCWFKICKLGRQVAQESQKDSYIPEQWIRLRDTLVDVTRKDLSIKGHRLGSFDGGDRGCQRGFHSVDSIRHGAGNRT